MSERTCFDVLAELFAKDVDPELVKAALRRTPDERLAWLEEMQALADEARKAREHEAARAPGTPR